MRHLFRLPLFISIFLFLFAALPLSAQEGITVTLPVESIPVGETQTVEATIDCPDQACNRLDITIRYDPAIILVNIRDTGLGAYFSERGDLRLLRNIIDNEEGTLRVTTSPSQQAPPADSNIFLQLSITALEIGTSPLTVESLDLGANVDSDSIVIEDGEITVTEGPPTLQVLRPLNSRSGPGAQFGPATTLQPETAYEIVGTSPDGAWLMLLDDERAVWVESSSRFIEITGDLLAIPIIEMQPTVTLIPTDTPTPAPTDTALPTATFTSTATPTASNTPTATPEVTDTPSSTPTSTSTPTPTATPTATATSTSTDTPSPTPTPTRIVVIATANTNANVRSGDGTGFAVIGSLRRGQTVELIGVSSRGTGWYAIELSEDELGWVADFVVTVEDDPDVLPEIDPPAAATVRRTQPPGQQQNTRPPQPGQPTQPPAQPTQPPAGDCSVFQPQSPLDGLANGITTFYWTLMPGADDYWVSIFNESGQNVRLASTGGVGTSISVDTSSTAIGGGTLFGWEVTAFQNGQVLCTTRRVIIPRAA